MQKQSSYDMYFCPPQYQYQGNPQMFNYFEQNAMYKQHRQHYMHNPPPSFAKLNKNASHSSLLNQAPHDKMYFPMMPQYYYGVGQNYHPYQAQY